MQYLMFPLEYIRQSNLTNIHECYNEVELTVMIGPKYKVVDVIDGEVVNPNECLSAPSLNSGT